MQVQIHALKWNEYIFCGQRARGKTRMWYLKSMFAWHSDTINIWTALTGFFFFTSILVVSKQVTAVRTSEDRDFALNLLLVRFYATVMIFMFIGKSTFHIFWPHSDLFFIRCSNLCRNGTVLAIFASFFFLTSLMFKQNHTAIFYWCVYGIFLLISRVLAIPDKYLILGVLLMFVTTGMHAVLVYKLNDSRMTRLLYPYAFGCSFFAVGYILYTRKIPEKWFPGRLDCFGNSENLMQACVLSGSIYHYLICINNL